MADWFKFFENDLDETRLQYAIAKHPEVIPVWVGILSEACRHKSGTVRWGTNEIELFGFSRRLGISIQKVNEAVNILLQIEYIQRGENTLTVLKWNDKQSEYCQKRSKPQSDVVPTVSRQCPDSVVLEERRGEEIRLEEKEGKVASLPNAPKASRMGKPTLDELKVYASKIGLPHSEVEKFFDFYESNGWKVSRSPMKSWESALRNWKRNVEKFAGRSAGQPNGQAKQEHYTDKLFRQIEKEYRQ